MDLRQKFLLAGISLGAGIAVGLGVSFVRAAWFEPTELPPNGNIAAPLNTSYISQYKGGGLLLGWSSPEVSLMTVKSVRGEGLDAVFTGPVGIGGGEVNVSGAVDTSVYKNQNKTGDIAKGGLDISWAGDPATLVLGANLGSNKRTEGADKSFSIVAPHANLGAQNTTVIAGLNTTGHNLLKIGGGVALVGGTQLNAANEIVFYTAPLGDANKPGEPTVTITRPYTTFNNQIQIVDSTPGDDAGKVLTSDANGVGSWRPNETFVNFQEFSTREVIRTHENSVGVPQGYFIKNASNNHIRWQVPAGVTKVRVQVWGGGGAGGVGDGINNSRGGGGGGAGGYVEGVVSDSSLPGTVFTINVGGEGDIAPYYPLPPAGSCDYGFPSGGSVGNGAGCNGAGSSVSSTLMGVGFVANGGTGGSRDAAGRGGRAFVNGGSYVGKVLAIDGGNGDPREGSSGHGGDGGASYASPGGLGGIYETQRVNPRYEGTSVGGGGGGGTSDAQFSLGGNGGRGRVVIWW